MTDLVGQLTTATEEETERLFASIAPEELVRAVRAVSDEELLTLVKRSEIRAAAVTGILARLEEYAVPERLAQVSGVVRFDLERRRGTLLERRTLRFAGGRVSLLDADDAATPGVTIHTSVLRFVRLVTGSANAALLLLSGRLDVEGDALLALDVGTVFRVPGQDSLAVDPTTLDPVEVATAIQGVRAAHLRRVMEGGFRPIVLGEIFRRFPEFLDAQKAHEVRLSVGFHITGSDGAAPDSYVVHVDHGACRVVAGDDGAERDATISLGGAEFLKLALGQLNPVTGVLRGRLKVKGDRAKALQLSWVMRIPGPR